MMQAAIAIVSSDDGFMKIVFQFLKNCALKHLTQNYFSFQKTNSKIKNDSQAKEFIIIIWYARYCNTYF